MGLGARGLTGYDACWRSKRVQVVVFTTYPSLDASRRLRINPIVAELKRRGCQVNVHCLINDWMFSHKNDGRILRSAVAGALAFSLALRLFQIIVLPKGSVVLVHREAFPFFTPWAEKRLGKRARRVVVDVDDAIHVQPTHTRDWRSRWRDPARFCDVLSMADLVTVGSPYMANIARQAGATAITIALTCPPPRSVASAKRSSSPRILWTGSQSTLGSLTAVLADVCAALAKVQGTVVILGGENIATLHGMPGVVARPWSEAAEREELNRCWFGLMPIPDSDWERGKSGYKAILYVSAGLEALVSPVGFNIWLASQVQSVRLVADGEWRQAVADQLLRGSRQEASESDKMWLSQNADVKRTAEAIVDRILAT